MSEFRKVVVGRKRRGAGTSLQKCHAGLLRKHRITPLHPSDAQIAALQGDFEKLPSWIVFFHRSTSVLKLIKVTSIDLVL